VRGWCCGPTRSGRRTRTTTPSEGLSIDTRHAAGLEIEWWRAHREDQYAAGPENAEALIRALADLYAYTYGVEHSEVRRAAELRAEAMDVSDRWIAAGCDPADPLLAEERVLLVRSFAALPAAVHRPPTVRTVTATP
jgi:hypothetical protein